MNLDFTTMCVNFNKTHKHPLNAAKLPRKQHLSTLKTQFILSRLELEHWTPPNTRRVLLGAGRPHL